MHSQEPCISAHLLYLLFPPLPCALPLNYRAELSKPPLPKIISCFRGWKMWQLIFICRAMQWVSESSWGWGGGQGKAALKWQLGNMRGRSEGREQMKNGEGVEGGPEAADGKSRAWEGCTVWGCSIFPVLLLLSFSYWTRKVSLLLLTAISELDISDNGGEGAYSQQQGSLVLFSSPFSFFMPHFPHIP